MNSDSEKHSPFTPPFWMRPALVQTLIASMKFRKRGQHEMETQSNAMIFDCDDGVRLQGSYAYNSNNRALVIFLHGWEGSENSTYVMSCARYMYDRGCSVVRLNYRDHGDTHALNAAPFHAQRLTEVQNAVEQAAGLSNGAPVYVVGFSLGGNFALRIASRLKDSPIEGLKHIVSISPVIDPWEASPLVDENPLIRRYFYKKWTTSMKKKQAAFPDLYDFSGVAQIKTVMGLTDMFLPAYTEFKDAAAYFNSYRIKPEDLLDCPVDVSVVMAKDDPVIPSEDVATLKTDERVKLVMTDHGGHNGFFTSLLGPTWYDTYIEAVMAQNVGA